MLKISILILSVLSQSCTDMIEYSPFDVDIKTIEYNKISAAKISNAGITTDTVKIAVFSDVHENYDYMADAIQSINSQPGINFVYSAGDITSSGLVQEFEWYFEVAQTSRYPIITCIGVHDCWGNGITIFERMFGPTDMSFTLGKYKFILFNNTVWEINQNSPRYEWLDDQLSNPDYNNILLHHVPPKAGEIGDLHRIIYNQIVDTANTILIIQGHFHKFEDFYHNGIRSINANAVDHREYLIVSLINDQTFIKRIYF